MIGDDLDQWMSRMIEDELELRRRVLACQSLDDFNALKSEVQTKWDADVAAVRALIPTTIEQFEQRKVTKE